MFSLLWNFIKGLSRELSFWVADNWGRTDKNERRGGEQDRWGTAKKQRWYTINTDFSCSVSFKFIDLELTEGCSSSSGWCSSTVKLLVERKWAMSIYITQILSLKQNIWYRHFWRKEVYLVHSFGGWISTWCSVGYKKTAF